MSSKSNVSRQSGHSCSELGLAEDELFPDPVEELDAEELVPEQFDKHFLLNVDVWVKEELSTAILVNLGVVLVWFLEFWENF